MGKKFKKKSRSSCLSRALVWLMLIAILASIAFGTVMTLLQYFNH